MSTSSFPTSTLAQLRQRLRVTRENISQRREHDHAMTDPALRNEPFAARTRAVDAGEGDCHFCRY